VIFGVDPYEGVVPKGVGGFCRFLEDAKGRGCIL